MDEELIKSDAQNDALPIALYRISELSHETDDMDMFYQEAHAIIADLIYAKNFIIAEFNAESNTLSIAYVVDDKTEYEYESFQDIPEERFTKTLTGYMLRTGSDLHVDAKEMEELTEKGEIEIVGENSVDWLGIPLKKGEDVLGAIIVQSYDPKYTYSEADIELMRFLSRHLANILVRKKTESQLKESQTKLEQRVVERTTELAQINEELQTEIKERAKTEQLMKALYRIAVVASEANDIQHFYTILHEIMDSLIRTPNLYVAIKKESENGVFFPYYENEYYATPVDQPHLIQMQEMDHINAVIASQRSLRFSHDEGLPKNKDRNPMFSSWLGVPLKDEQQQTVGVLSALRYNVNEDFDDDDQNLMSYVAQQISSSLQRRHQKQALLDRKSVV